MTTEERNSLYFLAASLIKEMSKLRPGVCRDGNNNCTGLKIPDATLSAPEHVYKLQALLDESKLSASFNVFYLPNYKTINIKIKDQKDLVPADRMYMDNNNSGR